MAVEHESAEVSPAFPIEVVRQEAEPIMHYKSTSSTRVLALSTDR